MSYWRGFLENGTPQSVTRLNAVLGALVLVLSVVTGCAIAILAASGGASAADAKLLMEGLAWLAAGGAASKWTSERERAIPSGATTARESKALPVVKEDA